MADKLGWLGVWRRVAAGGGDMAMMAFFATGTPFLPLISVQLRLTEAASIMESNL